MPEEMDRVLRALKRLRTPLQHSEAALHALVAQALAEGGCSCRHEVPLGPRCRIDFLCEGGIGVEVKRGLPERERIRAQLQRYAACEAVRGLVLVTERQVDLPETIGGKPVRAVCLHRLWGIAL